MRHRRRAWMLAMAAMLLPTAAPGAAPAPLQAMGVTERLGTPVPGDLTFTDTSGEVVRLGDYFETGRPTLLVLAYYHCPMLCGLVLKGAAAAVQQLEWIPGVQYQLLTISFDPADTPVTATRKRDATLALLQRPIDPANWPFWTGSADSIERLVTALGLELQRDPTTGQFAHPAVLFVLTPDGRISRYLYGIEHPTRDVKLALLQASNGATGSTMERLLMRCFAYDPAKRRYAMFIDNFMRLGGSVIFTALAAGMAVLWRRERRRGGHRG